VAGPIRVDIDGLAGLAKTLAAIQQQLDTLGQDFGRFDAAIGAPKVKAKLSEVAGNWSRARQQIGQELSRLAAMADTAAATYRATEQDIAQAAASGPPGS
jgi:ABC-type transporter Mla subunit MlaD